MDANRSHNQNEHWIMFALYDLRKPAVAILTECTDIPVTFTNNSISRKVTIYTLLQEIGYTWPKDACRYFYQPDASESRKDNEDFQWK